MIRPARGSSGLVVLASLLLPTVAAADDSTESLRTLWQQVERAVDAASQARLPVPPVPVAVDWRPERMGALDLGAPILDLAIVDLDGDGKSELIALTDKELLRLDASGEELAVSTRMSLQGEAAVPRPRDPIGSLAVEEVVGKRRLFVAHTSFSDTAVIEWQGGWVESERLAGFHACPGLGLGTVVGRNLLDGRDAGWAGHTLPKQMWSLECVSDLVDAEGRAMKIAAAVDGTGALSVGCAGHDGQACTRGPASGQRYPDSGHAVAVSDFDNDGSAEVVMSSSAPAGERDRITVMGLRTGRVTTWFSRDFHAGVAAMAVGDLSGQGGRQLVVAVRFLGSSHTTFWRLGGGAP